MFYKLLGSGSPSLGRTLQLSGFFVMSCSLAYLTYKVDDVADLGWGYFSIFMTYAAFCSGARTLDKWMMVLAAKAGIKSEDMK